MLNIKYVILLIILLLPFSAVNSKALVDVEIYGLHDSVVRQIDNNGILFSGDSFQVVIGTNEKQNIFVIMKDSIGNVSKLETKTNSENIILAGQVFYYPGKDHWYKLDDNLGYESVYTFSGGVKSCTKKLFIKISKESINSLIDSSKCNVQIHVFNHIADNLFSLGKNKYRGSKPMSADEKRKIIEKLEKNNDIFKSKVNMKLAKISTNLPYQLYSKKTETTRGIKEVHLFKKISPSVVLIATADGGIGTGSVINNNGGILTNWHVVTDNKEVGVVFKPNTRREVNKSDLIVAEVLKIDEVSDLALIKVKKIPKGIKIIKFGDSKLINVGEDVHAIGHPKGEAWSYTRGYISSLRNDYEWTYSSNKQHKAELIIQTQTPISPGNSGGPLLSVDGKLLGVNSFSKEGQSLNYAVSIDDVRAFLKRKSSRTAKLNKTIEELLTEEYGFVVLGAFKQDMNDDGYKDYVMEVDYNENGIRDARLIKRGKDKKWIVLLDENENGKFEIYKFDSNGDGELNMAYIDSNDDGTYNVIAKDTTGDGEYDSYKPIK